MLRPEIVLGASGLPAQLLLIVEQGPRAGLLALRTPGDAEMSTLPPSADISWLCRSEIRHPGPLLEESSSLDRRQNTSFL